MFIFRRQCQNKEPGKEKERQVRRELRADIEGMEAMEILKGAVVISVDGMEEK